MPSDQSGINPGSIQPVINLDFRHFPLSNGVSRAASDLYGIPSVAPDDLEPLSVLNFHQHVLTLTVIVKVRTVGCRTGGLPVAYVAGS